MQNKVAEWTKDKVIYEVNLRQYSEEGSLASFESHLDRLKDLGVDILWFMPLHPIGIKDRKGTLGSYYAVKDYYAIDSMYGTMEEFKTLVHKIHSMGMYVIIDWVANHSSRDNAWITEHPEWYNQDSNGNILSPFDWTDVADMNYNNADLRKEMICALLYWLKETGIDGFRCDVAMLVPTEFWNDTVTELKKINPDIFMLAEAEEPLLQEQAFDMYYGWALHNLAKEIARGEKPAYELDKLLAEQDSSFPADTCRMNFTSNHDENSWNGTAFDRYGDALKAMTVLAFTLPDMPLIYAGQEAGLNKKLEFFEKDLIEWKDSPWFDFYQKLISMKKEYSALWNGNYGAAVQKIITNDDSRFYCFIRKNENSEVIVLINLGSTPGTLEIKSSFAAGIYSNYFTGENVNSNELNQVELGSWCYRVLVRK